jgi:hypothetical protein
MKAHASPLPVALRPVLLRSGLLLGAALDGLAALVLLLAPDRLLSPLALEVPEQPWLPWLLALLLGTFALFQLPPAYDIVSYSGNIACTLLARTVLGLFFLWASRELPGPHLLALVGGSQLALAAAQASCWLPERRGSVL